ncbi:MAG: penicillin-binding protein [Bryobacterales bacterium]|nr:penicillin-binding protein [Bryobacterales bacterium]
MKRILIITLGLVLPAALFAVAPVKKKTASARSSRVTAKKQPRAKALAATTKSKTYRAKRTYYSPWDTPTFADSTWGDVVDGEDLVVRRAAVQALGPYNGSVVVVNPNTGRVLTMVNQKLALTGAYQPCSTIKLVAGLAGLSEGIIERETRLRLSRGLSMDLTTALAKSNNPYFANIGEKLGFDKVNYYGRLLGLGEKTGLDIAGESAGIFPEEKPKGVPVGMMTSFGEAIGLTPLQLAAMVSTIANGGTLYYLQYPRNQEEALNLVPKVKRKLDVESQLPDMKPGMMGAVDFGTARRAAYDTNEPIFGKTGTCTDSRTHLGWFGSYNEIGSNKLVVVVLLTGGKKVNGPVAAGIAGQVYKNMSQSATAHVAVEPNILAR